MLSELINKDLYIPEIRNVLIEFGFTETASGGFRRVSRLREVYIYFDENDYSIRLRCSAGIETASIAVRSDSEYAETFPAVELLECGDGYKLVFRSNTMKTMIEVYQYE